MSIYKRPKKNNIDEKVKKYEPIVFINKPATSYSKDVIGIKSQIETIYQSIEDGATMIGVIADYGTGKSTISDILISDVLYNEHKYSTIRINMWASVSNKSNDNVSDLTKSFLFQLANGNNETKHVSKLSHYVAKRLSKNFNTISISTISTKLRNCGILSIVFYVLYKIFSQETFYYLNYNKYWILKFIMDFNPVFLGVAIVAMIYGIIDTSVAFSHWKKTGENYLESNDIFELYDEIATKMIENSFDNKQIVFIEDLDRIDNKSVIIEFIKELYRFQSSVSNKLKDKFIFIVAIKPESLLDNEKKDNSDEHLYSKLFDVIVNLKPIHFEDYESALISLLEKNENSKKKLQRLLEEKEDINKEHLPKSFNWILAGENLTLRDLKDRLNHAISIMVSLKNKNYKEVSNISFTACTAVAYLESAFPGEFYDLVKREAEFESFIRESYPIKNKVSDNKKSELLKIYNKIFNNDSKSSGQFVEILCKLVLDDVFDDDFRMYFYTYPDNSYVKTVDEKDVCNLIKLPNVYNNIDGLDEKIKRIFSNRPNSIVIDVICNLDKKEPYPYVLIQNKKLFEIALESNFEQTLDLLHRYTIDSNNTNERILSSLKMLNEIQIENIKSLLDKYVNFILDDLVNSNINKDKFIDLRKNFIIAFGKKVTEFSALFVNNEKEIPLITEEEICIVDDIGLFLKLIDENLLNMECDYIFEKINESKLSDQDREYAYKIYNKLVATCEESEHLGYILLKFLFVNRCMHEKYFDIILRMIDKMDDISKYINDLDSTELPLQYLIGIDKKEFDGGLNEEILKRLKDNKLFISYLLIKAPINQIDDIDYTDDSVADSILNAINIIVHKNTNVIIPIRKSIISRLKKVSEKYLTVFWGDFPIITKEELNTFDEFSNAIACIDGSRLNADNCDFVWEYCNQDVRDAEECFKIFEYLFDSNIEIAVNDCEVAEKLFYAFDFEKIKFSELSIDKQEEAINYIYSLLGLDDPAKSLKCIKHLKTPVSRLVENLQSEELIDEYIDFLNELRLCTDTSVELIEKYNLNKALCPEISEKLLEKGNIINYIIGKSLYDNVLLYDKNLLSVEEYFELYISKPVMFDILANNVDFLHDIINDELYRQITSKKLIRPLFACSQTLESFTHIWSTLEGNEYSEFILAIPKILTLDDSKEIKKFLCIKENMSKLGSFELYNKIDYLLWDSHKTHKREFKSIWNNSWKKQLREL